MRSSNTTAVAVAVAATAIEHLMIPQRNDGNASILTHPS